MNPEIKAAWLAALRSGEYKQGVGSLNKDGNMCCLGVLCDLHSKTTGEVWEGKDAEGAEKYRNESAVPTGEVVEWSGIECDNPHVKIQMSEDGEDTISMPLAELNDNGSTFEEIADLIEGQL